MWALNSADGSTASGAWPYTISGKADNDPTLGFNAVVENQRTGLLLFGGRVYAGFGSHCDGGDFRGWVVSVSTPGGLIHHRWVDEANPSGGRTNIGGGIWQSGGGLALDPQGRIFVATGNGTPPKPGSGSQFSNANGQSVLNLQVNSDHTMSVADRFTPFNANSLNMIDKDVGSGGPTVLPDGFGGLPTNVHLLVEPTKTAIYLLNRDSLGGMAGSSGPDNVVAEGPSAVWGHPAIWPGDGGFVYVVENNVTAAIKVYQVRQDAQGHITFPQVGSNGDNLGADPGSPVVTSNGSTNGSGVLWVTTHTGATSTLRAYNPVPVNGLLQRYASLNIGTAAKFSVPATDGNQVFVGTQDGKLLAFAS
jgi:hypothetical protein